MIGLILKLLEKYIRGWQTEYRFHHERRWRFDFAHPDKKIAVEIEGGAWIKGRHTRGKGYINDMEKYNAATLAGWKVLRYTPQQAGMITNDIAKLI